MGRRRVPGLEWLEPENTEQRQWAREYLLLWNHTKHFEYRDKIQPDTLYSHEEMLRIGEKIEQEDCARELFRDMKDTWRQERNRKKKKDSGYQVCAFTFSTTTKTNLQEMAIEQGTSATELLETLISKAHKTHASRTKKQKILQSKPEKTASNTFAGGRQPSVGGTGTAQSPASLDENAQIELEATSGPKGTTAATVTAPSITNNQERAIRGGTSTPDTHEQTDSPQAETPTDDELARNADWAKKSISELLTLRAENKAARAKQARPPSPPEQVETTATGAGSSPTTRSDEQD